MSAVRNEAIEEHRERFALALKEHLKKNSKVITRQDLNAVENFLKDNCHYISSALKRKISRNTFRVLTFGDKEL